MPRLVKSRWVGLLLMLAAPAGPALAHTQTGSLGAGAAATDYYQVSCSDDGSGPAASLIAQVTGQSMSGPSAPIMRHLPAPVSTAVVSVLIHKGNNAITSSDASSGDAAASPLVYLNGGDGVYDVFVNKIASGLVNYTLTFHCVTGLNGGGIHTGSDIVFKQRGAPPG
jgi:hypothetical protein